MADFLTSDARENLLADVQRAYLLAEAASSKSALSFLDHVVIDSRPEPRPYRDVARPWQWQLMGNLVPAFEAVTGLRKGYKGPRGFWFTLPRGHDKTSSLARLASWAVAFSPQRVSCIAAAGDREQANILAQFAQREADLNPWLKRRLHFKNFRMTGTHTGSTLDVISSDAFGSFGLKSDIILVDELTHWPKRDLWDTLMSGRQKVPGSLLVVITNAGTIGSWQHRAWQHAQQAAKRRGNWFLFHAPGQMETWMSKEDIEEDRKLLPPMLARRIVDNCWVSPDEESGFVTEDEARACERLGVTLGLGYRRVSEAGVQYVAAIDYGEVKDRCVMCVCHKDEDGIVVLDRMDVLQGSRQSPVRISAVEAWIDEVRRIFRKPTLVVDPYQMVSTLQKYEGILPTVRFTPRGGKANYELAVNLRGLILNKKIAWYPGAGSLLINDSQGNRQHDLTDEIFELTTEIKQYGWRMQTLPGKFDDRAVALGMSALELMKNEPRVAFKLNNLFF